MKRGLPVREELCRRGMQIDPIGLRCGEEREPLMHMAALCPKSQLIWKISPLRLDTGPWENVSVREWCGDMVKSLTVGNSWEIFLMFWWKIWEMRNLWIFEKKKTDVSLVVSKTLSLLGEFEAATLREPSDPPPASNDNPSYWIARPPNKFKLNTDAAISKEGKVGLGMVVRDYLVDVLMSGGKSLEGLTDVCYAESQAMYFGLKYAYGAGLRSLVVSSDCLQLVNMMLSNKKERTATQLVVDDILSIASICAFCCFSFQSRSCNKVAHFVAKHSLTLSEEQLWMEDCPSVSLPFVTSDKVAILI